METSRAGRLVRAWQFAWPGAAAAVVAAVAAGLAEGAAYADGTLAVVTAAGFSAFYTTPAGALLAWMARGLWLGWQPRALLARHTEAGGGAPSIAAWGLYVGASLALLGAVTLTVSVRADRVFTHARVAALASAIIVTLTVALLIALSRPLAGLLARVLRRIDAAVRRRGFGSPFRPLVLVVGAACALAAYLVGAWYVSIKPRIGHLDLGVSLYIGVFAAVGLVAYVAFLLAPRGRARAVAVGLPFTVWVALVGVAVHARYYRPFAMLDVWGSAPVSGMSIDISYRLDEVRAAFKLQEIRPAERAGAPHRDIVLITIDTLRADRTPLYGGPAKMPALRRMGAAGAVFEWAFSPGNTTRRSLPTVATGISPKRMRGRVVGWALQLDPRHITLAERLQAGGYETAAFVCCKSHFGRDLQLGMDRGIEHLGIEIEGDKLVSMTLDWLKERERRDPDRPLFLWLHLFEPHRWNKLYPAKTYGVAAKPRYDRMLGDVDRILAPLVDHLLDEERRQRTYVVLTSDHGEGLNEHGFAMHSTSLYNAQIRVPFVFLGPDVERRRIRMPVGLVDLAPTLLDLAGFQPPGMPVMDGQSLAEYLRGAATANPEDGEAYSVQIRDRSVAESMAAIVRGRHKLIVGPGDEIQLFDIIADPNEKTNLADSQPDLVESLEQRLEARRAIDRVTPF